MIENTLVNCESEGCKYNRGKVCTKGEIGITDTCSCGDYEPKEGQYD